jgi:ATP-dependent DNA ligase
MKVIKPMMAAKSTEVEIANALISEDWVAEEKFDGSRYVCFFMKDRLYFTSRRISVKTGLPVEKGLNLPHINTAVSELVGTVLDGEIVGQGDFGSCVSIMGSTPERALKIQEEKGFAVYKVFDILYYKGINVKTYRLFERRKYLEKLFKGIQNVNIQLVKQFSGINKRELFKSIVAMGGEGIILKNSLATYVEGRRNKDTWIKQKKQNSWQCFITGYDYPTKYSTDVKGNKIINQFYKKNWVAAVRFGVWKDGDVYEVGKTSGMTEEVRQQLSVDREAYMHKVIDIIGQEVTKGGHIRHPRWSGFRLDINQSDCTWENLKKSC